MISSLFNAVFYEPLYNLLVFFASILPSHDIGLAIILFTLFVKFILFPLSHKSIVTQKKIRDIDPELRKIKEQLKGNREEQARKTMELYRQHGVSPFSGFFSILVQLPVFIALFMIFKTSTLFHPESLYSFVNFPENINSFFLGIKSIDLSKSNYILAFLAAISQFFQVRLAMPAIKTDSGKKKKEITFTSELQKSMSIQMKYIMPVFIFFISMRFPSGLALYWTTSNIFAIVHEIVVKRKSEKIKQNAGTDKTNKSHNNGNSVKDGN